VAAAVILPAEISWAELPWLSGVADSKLLSSKKREELAPKIEAWVRSSAIGSASVEEIDRLNIHHASHLAMMRAIEALGVRPDHVLVDGKFIPKGLKCDATAVIKGDQKCLSIACASIIAKVWRDRHMTELDLQYPGYGFSIHKGYSTPAHNNALKELGASVLHRRSFAPVAAVLTPAWLGPAPALYSPHVDKRDPLHPWTQD
jgi:ribonuclease HII